MLNQLKLWVGEDTSRMWFGAFSMIVLLSIFAAVWSQEILFIGAPVLLLVVYVCLVDLRKIFYLLLVCIPLSMEYFLPNGLATDLPTEPLIVGLMLVYLF